MTSADIFEEGFVEGLSETLEDEITDEIKEEVEPNNYPTLYEECKNMYGFLYKSRCIRFFMQYMSMYFLERNDRLFNTMLLTHNFYDKINLQDDDFELFYYIFFMILRDKNCIPALLHEVRDTYGS